VAALCACRRAGVVHLDRRVLLMPASVRMPKPCLCRPRSMTATETVRNADLYQIADIVALVATGNRQIKRFFPLFGPRKRKEAIRAERRKQAAVAEASCSVSREEGFVSTGGRTSASQRCPSARRPLPTCAMARA
jgi:hypothetical protein